MKTIEAVAMILLSGPITSNEIYRQIKEMGVEDCPGFQSVPGGIHSREIRDFLLRLQITQLVNFSEGRYFLTPAGRKHYGKMVAKALFREKFGSELTREVFEEKYLM
jgi:hypothetical protein